MKTREADRRSYGIPLTVMPGMHRPARTVARAARSVTPEPVRGPFGKDRVKELSRRPASHPKPGATVGYVIDRFPSGSHCFVLHEILALERRGVDVHVFSLGMPEGRLDDIASALARLRSPVLYFLADPQAGGAASERMMFVPGCPAPDPAGSGTTSEAARWLARHVSARRIDHLHAHGAAEATDVAREAGRMTRRGYSFTAHARDLHAGDASAMREKVLEAKFAVALSEFDHGVLIGICGRGAADKLHRIPMSVDPQDYKFARRDHLRNAILTVGPLVEQSGFVDLIQAMGILRGRGLVAQTTIVGEGEFEAPLRAAIDRHGLTGHVDIIATVSRYELAALIQTHTLMVLPWTAGHRDRDVLSNLVLDGMAAGLPVLSTDGPPIREFIDDGLNGRIFEAHDPVGLAGALDTFLGSARLRERIASNARTTVESVFAARENVAHLANLFSGTIAGQPFSA